MSTPAYMPVQPGYDAWSEVYDTDGNPLIALEEPVVCGWLSDVAGRRIADVGCGTGRHAVRLAQAGAKVVALDVSSGMLAKARAKDPTGEVLFCCHRLPEPLPLPDGSCDHVLFALVGEHVTALKDIYRDFARVLGPGGSVVFTALHPAMNLRGITARFFDPGTGREVRVEAHEHTFADYVNPIPGSGLALAEVVERKVTPETARLAPRAEKYLDWPMLLAMRLVKPAEP